MWEVSETRSKEYRDHMLGQGWEPYTVTVSYGQTAMIYHLRRQVPEKLTIVDSPRPCDHCDQMPESVVRSETLREVGEWLAKKEAQLSLEDIETLKKGRMPMRTISYRRGEIDTASPY